MSSLREEKLLLDIGGELDIKFDSGTPFVGEFFAKVEATKVTVIGGLHRFMLSEVNIVNIYVPNELIKVEFEELQELHGFIEKEVTTKVHGDLEQKVRVTNPGQFQD